MAGGTGGHVFPGLSVAHYLHNQGIEVHWLGTNQGLESHLVPDANLPLHCIQITGVRGKGWKYLLSAPLKVCKAILQAKHIIKDINPDVVIGMGGYVSGPGGIASWIQGYPLIIHEQNAIAGLTNKILARFAKKVLEGFPATFKPGTNIVTIGNPVRAEIENLPPPQNRFDANRRSFHLLVLGGSLGAQALNDVVPRALAKLKEDERPEVFHQTGDKHFEIAKNTYKTLGMQTKLVPFIKDMAQAYAWADVVLCRAGALTVSELCTVGLGAIFIPFPYAVDDHQTANANFMVKKNAALCIQQKNLTDNMLADIVRELSHSPQRRLAMADAAYQLRNVNVAEKIFKICKEICH